MSCLPLTEHLAGVPLQPEPAAGPDSVAVAVKLPSGSAPRRRFLSGITTVKDLYAWVCFAAHEEALSGGSTALAVAVLQAPRLLQAGPGGVISEETAISEAARPSEIPNPAEDAIGPSEGARPSEGSRSFSSVPSASAEWDAEIETESPVISAAAAEICALVGHPDKAWLYRLDASWSLVEPYPRRVVPCGDHAGFRTLAEAGIHGQVLFAIERTNHE